MRGGKEMTGMVGNGEWCANGIGDDMVRRDCNFGEERTHCWCLVVAYLLGR
jgi:hypothetical protein